MAVFTEIDSSGLRTISQYFGIESVISFIGLADGDNESTYILMTDSKQFLVTFFETAIDPVDLERAFKTMEILREAGVPCPATVRTLTGAASITINGHLLAIVEVVSGTSREDLSTVQAHSLGRNIAQIHRVLLSQYPVRWNSKAGLARGWLHGALRPDNVFFLNDIVSGIINFRMRHEGFLIEELAIAAAAWCVKNGALQAEIFQALISGYAEMRNLTAQELERLPFLIVSSLLRIRSEGENFDAPTFETLAEIQGAAARICRVIAPEHLSLLKDGEGKR